MASCELSPPPDPRFEGRRQRVRRPTHLRQCRKGDGRTLTPALESNGALTTPHLPNVDLMFVIASQPSTPTRPAVLHEDALSSVPRALTALVYTHRSLPTARKFAHAFFFSREVDLRAMMKFRDPKKALSETVRKFGRERPISRCVFVLALPRILHLLCAPVDVGSSPHL